MMLGSGQIQSAIFRLGLALENFSLKSQIFQFYALQVKKNLIGSDQKVPRSMPGQSLITAGQKYARIGLAQGPSICLRDCIRFAKMHSHK